MAVFLPLPDVGRLLHEFAVTLFCRRYFRCWFLTLTPAIVVLLKASKPVRQKRLRGFCRMLVAYNKPDKSEMGAQSYRLVNGAAGTIA